MRDTVLVHVTVPARDEYPPCEPLGGRPTDPLSNAEDYELREDLAGFCWHQLTADERARRTTTIQRAPVTTARVLVLTDPATLMLALDDACSVVMGRGRARDTEVDAFIAYFHQLERTQAELEASGGLSYRPDPAGQALAWAEANGC